MHAADEDDLELDREARRLCQRYVDEVVLAFDLCPWAAPALRAGRVQMFVIHREISSENDFAAAARDAARVLGTCADTPDIELALLLFPRARVERLAFDGLLRRLRVGEGEQRGERTFALAAFHPDAAPDRTTPERLIPFLRRSPDPMIQAVRTATLERIEPVSRAGTGFVDVTELVSLSLLAPESLLAPPPEPLRLRIAKQNERTLTERGVDAFERAVADIIADRERTYARLDDDARARHT